MGAQAILYLLEPPTPISRSMPEQLHTFGTDEAMECHGQVRLVAVCLRGHFFSNPHNTDMLNLPLRKILACS